eukprot:1159150-Amphidinium_carterae.1
MASRGLGCTINASHHDFNPEYLLFFPLPPQMQDAIQTSCFLAGPIWSFSKKISCHPAAL